MSKSPKYSQGQELLLINGRYIVLLERWDTKIQKKYHETKEVEWLAFYKDSPKNNFVLKESEISTVD